MSVGILCLLERMEAARVVEGRMMGSHLFRDPLFLETAQEKA